MAKITPTPEPQRRRTLLPRLGALLTAAGIAAGSLVGGLAVASPAAAATEDTYVIGTDTTYAPFEFNDGSTLKGIDIDLMNAIAEDQGFTVEWQQLGFDAAVQALQSNQVDGVMAGMSITDEREQTFDFGDGYFTGGIQFGVLDSSDIQSLDDLEGQTVAVKTGTQGQTYAESLEEELGLTITPYAETTDMVDAVKAGQAVAYAEDYPVIGYGITQGSGFRLIGEPALGGEYGFAVNKGENPELIEKFNAGLANLKASGEYDEIIATYIGSGSDNGSGDAEQTPPLGNGENFLIGTDTTYAPFEFNDGSALKGIDIDLLNAIAKNQNFTVEWQQLGFDAALQALQSNQVDGVMAGMSITDERRQTFDFGDGYFTGGIQFGVLDSSDIETLDDLQGQTVAVKTGTQGQTYAESLKEKYDLKVTPYAETTDMVDAVKAGQAVAYAEDYPVLAYGITQGSGFRLIDEPALGGEYGFAVNKGQNPELIEMFNAGLANLKASGEYDEIIATYVGTDGSEGGSGASAEQAPSDIFSITAKYWPTLMQGLGWTLLSTIVALVAAFVLGIIFGFGRLSKILPFRWISTAYVYVFRGTPILIQAFFVFFAVPQLLEGSDIKFSPFVAGAITLALNTGAYMTEIIRGGILAVDPGQNEASRSLGLGHWKTMRKVVLPQAFRIMIPSFVNQSIITLKDTSLLSVIGLAELTFQSKQIIASTYMSAQILTVVAVIYFVVITLLTLLADRLERKFNS
ncbi:ABC transporter permease subunit [Microbacterium stercoris]|uniref:ABC transporter permease subunit n=1 Tax=Microbacterium stercoris TaxID=2820289 RepID=A0A939QT65_9MICO|nr:ABC transporter permease subunit [Microbacterium stercoris]MBO3665091.1 ABC transporter permease subunit [Microbacterium stercoris]